MRWFGPGDLEAAGSGFQIKNKVVVLYDHASLVPQHGQLYFCLGGEGADGRLPWGSIELVSLWDGGRCECRRDEAAGVLKSELLPEYARLQLSQIRPPGALDLQNHIPEYSGYSFLPDGRYVAGVWLCTEKEVQDYVEMQRDYQHRVLICDRDDFTVLEIVEGKRVFPDEQILQKAAKESRQRGEMAMT